MSDGCSLDRRLLFLEPPQDELLRIPLLGTDVKIRPPPGGASSIKSLMFVLSKAEQFGVPMRLLPHTGGVYGLWLHQAKPTSDQGDDLSLFSSLRGGPATRAMEHWCENSFGGSSFSWFRGGPARAMEHLGE